MTRKTGMYALSVGILLALGLLLMPTPAASFVARTPTGTVTPGTRANPLVHPCTRLPFKTIMTGAGLEDAYAVGGSPQNQYSVSFTLADNEEAKAFERFTISHIGQPLAIVLDGQVISVPTVQAAITTYGEIAGSFTPEAAKVLALQLRSGALPVVLDLLSLEPGTDGLRAVLGAVPDTVVSVEKMNQARQIIESRANGLDITPVSVIDILGEIVVSLPKTVGDPTSVIGVLKTTALLEFVDFSRKETCQADMPRAGEYVETDVQITRRINMKAPPTATPVSTQPGSLDVS